VDAPASPPVGWSGRAPDFWELCTELRAAGFDLDFGVDGSGLFVKYLRRGSGY
jgi:hypothetical protein